MDAISEYLALSEPERSNHLWRYSPWNRVHPTGDIADVPEFERPSIKLSDIEGKDAPLGVRLVEKDFEFSETMPVDKVSSTFLKAASIGSQYTVEVDSGFNHDLPIMLEIDCGSGISAIQLNLEIGKLSNFELVTKIVGSGEWFGLMRCGKVEQGSKINDVVICLMESGTILRNDCIEIGRDAEVNSGSVSSGSERNKSDLRFNLGEKGSRLRVLGSIMSAEEMRLDHHIEIHHNAPETFSRLSWHSACGGKSKTVGTGMLKIYDGSKGADAAQIFHNLLLSKQAEADSIPELEVLEHEVVGCGHGTANGPIDEDQIFYLESRGFDNPSARRALVAAFLNSTLSQMGSDFLHDWLIGVLTRNLENLEA